MKDEIAMAVDFDSGENQEVEIDLDDRAKKKLAASERAKDRLADREAYEKLGLQVLRLKADTYRTLKKQIDQLGIKTIGHCSIMIGREKAESVIYELDAIAKEWEDAGSTVDPQVRVALQSLKLDCIKVMVSSGAEHLRAERQVSDDPSKGNVQLPFEAGQQVAIVIGQKPKSESAQIEDAGNQG